MTTADAPMKPSKAAKKSPWWAHYMPAFFSCVKEGYTKKTIIADLIAGITVGVVALPLAMAFGIASIPESVVQATGISPPAIGLVTAIVAGFLISFLGGSRVQIGGPAGAFIVIIYAIIAQHGYDGLVLATLMAGVLVVLMGLLRFGAVLKFIPMPVIIGFTTGIAVIIFSSQMKDFFGLSLASVPPEVYHKWVAYIEHSHTVDWTTLAVALGTLAFLIVMKIRFPKIPAMMLAVVLAAGAVAAFNLPVATVGSKFGAIPSSLPLPSVPAFSFEAMLTLIPAAFTIAFLAAIESLLSAVVADGMTGGRHKADGELVAQGVANIASSLFGGLPVTGAIARTATNVKSGAKTPVAGMIHAITLLAIMMIAAPLASYIPLAALAAVLVMVCYTMAELHKFFGMFRAPRYDLAVMLITFVLTVFADLTVAVGVGVVLASLLFVKRMIDTTDLQSLRDELNADDTKPATDVLAVARARNQIPAGVEVYEVHGPFFFGVADTLRDVLGQITDQPKIFVLDLHHASFIDATALHALEHFVHRCQQQGITLILSGVLPKPLKTLTSAGLKDSIGADNIVPQLSTALTRAQRLLGAPAVAA